MNHPDSFMDQGQSPDTKKIVPEHTSSKKKWYTGIGILLLLLIGGAIYFLSSPNSTSQRIAKDLVSQVEQKGSVGEEREDFGSFALMTIPFLREKTYTSTLAALVPAYDGENYAAYTTYYLSDGLKVNGLLTKPTGDVPKEGWPAIVFVHGYIPPASYATLGEAYSSYVDYLARNGFVVFKIDLRGHGQSEGEPGGAYYSSDYISDVLHAYSALENASFVNKKAIGLWGHSMAGNVSMRSWAVKKHIPAVVIWAGAVYTYEDMREYGITDSSYQPSPNMAQRSRKRQELFEKFGSPSAQAVFWKEVAPVNYLSELRGALQLHHAVDDDVVSINYSRNLNTILKNSSLPHAFYEYPSGGHNISGPSFSEAMERTVDFYKTHLK